MEIFEPIVLQLYEINRSDKYQQKDYDELLLIFSTD